MQNKFAASAYWILTILFCLVLGGGGVADLLLVEDAVEIVTRLGYPEYFLRMLGVFKILGVLALLSPGCARLKEWAYAGFAIDLIGAVVSHLASGDGFLEIAPPIALLGIGILSYVLRPEDRRLGPAPI